MTGIAFRGGNERQGRLAKACAEVAIFNYSMTANQLFNLYTKSLTLPALTLTIAPAGGGNVTISWPFGRLLEATNVAGPYLPNGQASPYTTAASGTQKFYRVVAP